jgi:hypothetical protein
MPDAKHCQALPSTAKKTPNQPNQPNPPFGRRPKIGGSGEVRGGIQAHECFTRQILVTSLPLPFLRQSQSQRTKRVSQRLSFSCLAWYRQRPPGAHGVSGIPDSPRETAWSSPSCVCAFVCSVCVVFPPWPSSALLECPHAPPATQGAGNMAQGSKAREPPGDSRGVDWRGWRARKAPPRWYPTRPTRPTAPLAACKPLDWAEAYSWCAGMPLNRFRSSAVFGRPRPLAGLDWGIDLHHHPRFKSWPTACH